MTAIEQLRASYPGALVVDTGGTIAGSGSAADLRTDGLIVKVLGSLGYDALNAGPGELLAGPSALRELAAGQPPLVSANGVIVSADAPPGLLKKYVVKTVGGLRVALVGVTDGGPAAYGTVEPTRPAADALRTLMPEIRSRADLVVVLADLDVSSIRPLVLDELGVDVVLGARSSATREATMIGNTVVANAGGLGRFVDRVTLSLGSDGRVVGLDFQEIPLDASVAEDPGVAQLSSSY